MVVRVTVAGRVTIEVGAISAGEMGLGRLGRIALAYLVCERHRPVPRDELADALWGEDLPASWEQLLRGLAGKIRATVGRAGLDPTTTLITGHGAYQIHLPADAVVDVEEAATDLQAAVAALAAGDAGAARDRASSTVTVAGRQFLPGGSGRWVERQQAELRELHLRALEVLARAATAQGLWADAVRAADEAVSIEPFRESAYLALMEAHAGAGSRGEALRAYERCRRVLADELGVRPSAPTEAAFVALLGDEPAPAEAGPPSTSVLALPPAVAQASGAFVVGRGPEVARLEAAFKRAIVEGRQTVLVAGEPGIGKTALVSTFARDAHAGGARMMYGRCDEGLGTPYQPFAEALSHFVAEAPIAELTRHVAVHGGELGRLVPQLARRLPDAPRPEVTDPEADRHRLFSAIGSLLAQAAEAVPVIVVVDDLHWAAPPSLALLRYLLRAIARSPILVVGTYRNTDIGPDDPLSRMLADLRREPAVDRLALRGLDEDGVTAFVRVSRATAHDEEGLARALHAHTAGNPFFVGELLRHLDETGATYRREGTWSYYAGADALGIPEGVREVVARRLHRLPETAREMLRWASVIGADFDLEVLQVVTGEADAEILLDALDDAVRAHLVVERGAGRYGFAHALVRDALHAELSTTRRARRHRTIADALESMAREDVRRLPALVHHFCEAASSGGATKAADYAIAAARQAFAQSAWEDAVAFLERGLDALAVLDPPDLERRCDLLLILAETWCRFWDVPKMRAAAEAAIGIARTLGSPERFGQAVRWSLTSAPGTDPQHALRLAEEALVALGDDAPGLRALILARMAPYAPDAAAVTGKALALARVSGDGEALGVALSVRAKALAETPAAAERLAAAEELVSAAPPGGWDGWRGGHEQRAIARLVIGDRAGFEEDAGATVRLGAEDRFWYYEKVGRLWKATRALLDGRFHEVERLAAEADGPGDRMRVPGAPMPVSELYAIQVAKMAFERGRPEKAVGPLQTVLQRAPAHPVLRAMLAYARADMGEVEAARHEFELATKSRARLSATAAYLAEVAAALDDPELAALPDEQLRPLTGLVVAAGQVAHCPGAVDRYVGQLAAVCRRWEQADEHFRIALRVDAGLRSPPLVARTRYWYGRMLLARGKGADAGRARDLLGASFDTAETLGMEGLARSACQLLERR